MSNINLPTSFNLNNEVKNFELNDFINKDKGIELTKMIPDDDEYDADDLLYTNALVDDIEGDKLDKSRYVLDKVTYLNIQSKFRETNYFVFSDESHVSTGEKSYYSSYDFFPYKSLNLNINNNMIYFRIFNSNTGETIVNLNTNEDIFYINLNINSYTVEQLQTSINEKINNTIKSSSHPDQLFDPDVNILNITCENNPDTDDPFIILITINSIDPYQFQCQFSEENQFNGNTPFSTYSVSNYNIKLNNVINNVKSIRLISSNIINSDTIINDYNNIINLLLSDGHKWQLIIPVGDYSIDELLTYIIDEMNLIIFNHLGIGSYFEYTYDNITGIIKINKAVVHTLNFIIEFVENEEIKWRNLRVMLGFKNNIMVYTSSITNAIITSKKINNKNIVYYDSYMKPNLIKSKSIWINLNNYETIYDVNTNKYYFNKFCFFNNNNDGEYQQITTIFDNPIELSYINISLYDELGMLYNANKTDHWFILEIIYQGDRLYSTNINSQRDYYGGINTSNKVF